MDTHGNDEILKALRDWEDTLEVWVRGSPVIGRTAFLKTHAHIMDRHYWLENATRPYDCPDIMNLFGKMRELCGICSIGYEKWTVDEVTRFIINENKSLERALGHNAA
jgi:hypothetical protein